VLKLYVKNVFFFFFLNFYTISFTKIEELNPHVETEECHEMTMELNILKLYE